MDFKDYMDEYDDMEIIDLEDEQDSVYANIITEFGEEIIVKVADNRMELFEVAMMVESYEKTNDETVLNFHLEYLSLEEKKLRVLGYKALEDSLEMEEDYSMGNNSYIRNNKSKKNKNKRKIAKKSKRKNRKK